MTANFSEVHPVLTTGIALVALALAALFANYVVKALRCERSIGS